MNVTIGLKLRILEAMQSDKKQLWSIPDLLNYFPEANVKSCESHLRTLRINGDISRHIDNDINDDKQYAVSIKNDKIEPYTKQDHSAKGNFKTKRKGKLLTGKEIRSMFAAHYNNMAKLEDSVMAVIEQFEATEKEMTKIRIFLKQ